MPWKIPKAISAEITATILEDIHEEILRNLQFTDGIVRVISKEIPAVDRTGIAEFPPLKLLQDITFFYWIKFKIKTTVWVLEGITEKIKKNPKDFQNEFSRNGQINSERILWWNFHKNCRWN